MKDMRTYPRHQRPPYSVSRLSEDIEVRDLADRPRKGVEQEVDDEEAEAEELETRPWLGRRRDDQVAIRGRRVGRCRGGGDGNVDHRDRYIHMSRSET